MKNLVKKYYSVLKLCALLVVQFIALASSDHHDRHHHDVQSRNYEHPRFGDSSIRSCAFNQYLDEEEGRCMIIPGGGRAISIDHSTTCRNEALRGHQSNPRIYYVCRRTKTIVAECERGKYFDNRLKRCTINSDERMDEERNADIDGDSYNHLDLPACVRPGKCPVSQNNCSLYYSCTSNGFRLFRTIHKCPSSTGFDPFVKKCTKEISCPNESSKKPKKRPEVTSTTKFISTTVPSTKFSSTTASTTLPPRPTVTQSMKTPENQLKMRESITKLIGVATTESPRTVTLSTKAPDHRPEILTSPKNVIDTTTAKRADNEPEVLESTKLYSTATTLLLPVVTVTIKMPTNPPEDLVTTIAPNNQTEVFQSTKFIDTTATLPKPPTITVTKAPIDELEILESTVISATTAAATSSRNLEKSNSSTADTGMKTTIYIEQNQEFSVTEKITSPIKPSSEKIIPSKSTIYDKSLDISSEAPTLDYSQTTEGINEAVEMSKIIHTSTISSDYESTAKPFTKIASIIYNTYADDYVTLRSDNTQTTDNNFADLETTISTKNDESTIYNSIDDSSSTSKDKSFTDVTIGISNQHDETTTISDFWKTEQENSTESTVTMVSINEEAITSDPTLEDLKTSERENNFIDSTTIVSTKNAEETTSEIIIETTTDETITESSTKNDEAPISSTIEDLLLTTEKYENITNETISTSEKNDETSSTIMEDIEDATVTMSSSFEEITTEQNSTEESAWTSDSSDSTKETSTLEIGLQDSYSTESSNYNASEKLFLETTIDTSDSSTIFNEVQITTIESTPISTLDASDDYQYTEIAATTPNEFLSIESSTLASNSKIKFTPEETTMITINDFSPSASSTPRYEDETIIAQEKLSSNVDFTTPDPYKNPISLSSDLSENEKLITSDESIISTSEASIISNQQESSSTASTDLFASTKQDEEFMKKTADSIFNYTRTSPGFLDEFTESPSREIDLVSTTSSQLEDSQVQDSNTLSSALNISEEPTTVDTSVESTNLLSTAMPLSDFSSEAYLSVSTHVTTADS